MDTFIKNIISTIIVSIIVFFLLFQVFGGQASTSGGKTAEISTFDKVLSRGEIRVGYVIYPPFLMKDLNSGELSGVFYDALENAGESLGLEINWAEEVGWGTMIEGLKTNRYDMIGSAVWPSSGRAREVSFTIPVAYSVISAYSRPDDFRFDRTFDAINDPSVTISFLDGTLPQSIAKDQFPRAKTTSLSQLADDSQNLLNVSTRKADIAFVEVYIGAAFLKNNPGSVKIVQPGNPIRINGVSMVTRKGDIEFKSALNVALREQLNSGEIDRLIEKYASRESFYPIAKPFDVPR